MRVDFGVAAAAAAPPVVLAAWDVGITILGSLPWPFVPAP